MRHSIPAAETINLIHYSVYILIKSFLAFHGHEQKKINFSSNHYQKNEKRMERKTLAFYSELISSAFLKRCQQKFVVQAGVFFPRLYF